MELTVLMPCLNERDTVAKCVETALTAIKELGIDGEVLIADNGSSDGSQAAAREAGARICDVSERGYGAALRAGTAAARGRYIIMGDADDSYDFSNLAPYLERLRAGDDLVMGNRFRGGIAPGAMPWKHRWIGNPVLSGLGRVLFRSPVHDFHCGMRGYSKTAFARMDLHTTGMEFASEMVVKATLRNLQISEVPTPLRRDGRSRKPHLRSWRDGWRHLRFLLLLSPRWLFVVPGLALMLLAGAVSVWLEIGEQTVGSLRLDIHTLLVSGVMVLVGYQLVVFGLLSRTYGVNSGLLPRSESLHNFRRVITLERGLLAGAFMGLAGLVLLAASLFGWGSGGFSNLDPQVTMRRVIPGVILLAMGVETIFASFLLSVFDIPHSPVPPVIPD